MATVRTELEPARRMFSWNVEESRRPIRIDSAGIVLPAPQMPSETTTSGTWLALARAHTSSNAILAARAAALARIDPGLLVRSDPSAARMPVSDPAGRCAKEAPVLDLSPLVPA